MRIILALIAIIALIFAAVGLSNPQFLSFLSLNNETELLSPLVGDPTKPELAAAAPSETQTPNADQVATSSAYQELFQRYASDSAEIDISIDVVDITSNKQYQYNPDRVNIGASTTKLFAASTFLSELEQGKYTYETKLGTYSAKFQLQQMINQSNNISWELFYNLLTRRKIEDYVHRIGSKGFDISENALKASDMTNYLVKLYKNQLHSEETTKLLLSHMQKTNEETFIPKNVENYTIYHKNGQLEEVVNEAILAVGEEKTLAIAIYTDGKDKWEYTKRRVLFKDLITDILKQ